MNTKIVSAGNGKRRMETGDHFKNGASSKSLMSRGNVIHSIIALLFLFLPFTLWGQVKVTSESSNIDKSQEMLVDYFRFEDIEYEKLIFTSKDLRNKTYKLSVKEIWDGVITKDSTIVDTKRYPDFFKTVGDTIFTLRVMSKSIDKHKLKMFFIFPRFSIIRKFDAAFIDDGSPYRLRKVVGTEMVEFDKNFCLMVNMLPYVEGNTRHYCKVADSGEKIEDWGKKFGIKHYLVFEMKFETL